MLWGLSMVGRTRRPMELYDWPRLFRALPLIKADELTGCKLKFWKDWVRHPRFDRYWDEVNIENKYHLITVPALIMGDNYWRDEHEWPLARTRWTHYYLHSRGRANSLEGDGVLSDQPPADEPPDQFTYDPRDPVPTIGGNNCCRPDIVPYGPYDQRPAEKRPDVLVYTTPPPTADVEVTGPITVKLYASSSAPDTDFTAKLVDVFPDGYAMNLCDGIIRARYRRSFRRARLLTPGRVYEFTIDCWVTGNVFRKGHRIRLDISSSNFPRFDRNPNTGHTFGMDAVLKTARQTIHHNAQSPSHVILPVIPSGRNP